MVCVPSRSAATERDWPICGGSGETVSTSRITDVDSGREVQVIPKASDDRPALSHHGDLIAIVEAGAGVNICDVKAGSCRLLAFTETHGRHGVQPA